jgi:hypothetical protein
MKLSIVSFCIACASVFAQVPNAQANADMQKLALETRLALVRQMGRAISQHQPIQLPMGYKTDAFGPKATITATGILGDYDRISDSSIDDVLRLVGVEIRTEGLVLQADELRLHWHGGTIEPVGNVRVKPVPQ